jgi:hypothetical protein
VLVHEVETTHQFTFSPKLTMSQLYANDQQENLCEKVCLFSALTSHNAMRSLIKKGEKYDE